MTFTIRLPMPPSANAYWGNRVVTSKATGRPIVMPFVTDEARLYKEQAAWQARAAGAHRPIEGWVSLEVVLFPKAPQNAAALARANSDWEYNIRCLDVDNALKVLIDALKDVVFTDDKRVRRITAERMAPVEGEAYVIATVRPIIINPLQQGLFT